jgi:hypothetical protein
MAVAIIGRPSWPYRPTRGHDPGGRVLPDRAQPDQGPAQEIIGEMAWLLRDPRSSMLLGGSALSTISWPRPHLPLGTARMARRRAQIADTWTHIAAAYLLVWIVVILLGL